MFLICVSLIALTVVAFMIRRERRYLKKSIKDVANDDIKKLLNIPTNDAVFPKSLKEKPQKPKASIKILHHINTERS